MSQSINLNQHVRVNEISEELSQELKVRGFTKHESHLFWAKNHPCGLITLVLSFAPDDEEGGWFEPSVGYVDQRIETKFKVVKPIAKHTINHTLLVQSTKWEQLKMLKQPAHAKAETLLAANKMLKWWSEAVPLFEENFIPKDEKDLQGHLKLYKLFNTKNSDARRVLNHELHRAIRGLMIAKLSPGKEVMEAYDFHRERLLESGWWNIYGEQIRIFAMKLI